MVHNSHFLMTHVHNRCTSDKEINFIVEEGAVGELSKHLGCTLRVSDVRELGLSSYLENMIDLGSRIVFTVFDETVVEELFWVSSRIPSLMLATVNVSSVVTNPDVVALVCKYHRERLRTSEHPRGRLGEETVLQEHRLSANLHVFSVNSEDCQIVAVGSQHFMRFTIQILLYDEIAHSYQSWSIK